MPVVLTTPVPHVPERAAPDFAILLRRGRDLLPRAHTWSRKTLRATPRALVITAPFIALFGIWAARGLVTHHRHSSTEVAQSKSAAAYPSVEVMTPAKPPVTSLASAFIPAPSAAPAVAPAPLPTADPAELTRASSHGLPALEALATKFPGDAAVAVALASQQARAQRFEAAVATVDHLLAIAPNSAQNGKVMGILWRAAQSPASEQSFASLRKLGGRGTDIAFDLATTAGVRDAVRERAKSELTSYLAFDASDDTRIATALLLAPDCGTRKSLLERAEREGGKRTHAILESFARGAGCTSSAEGACNSCMMGSPVLAHALAHLATGERP
jgi:Flp pilus assembly protein TadD